MDRLRDYLTLHDEQLIDLIYFELKISFLTLNFKLMHYIRKILNLFYSITIILIIVSCTTTKYVADIKTNQTSLYQIKSFQIRGKTSIKTPDTSFSTSIFWQQNYENYVIHLFGTLGIGAINIEGHPNYVKLTNNKKQTFTAKSPEQLMQQQLGWHLPISNLYYWIHGLPNPNIKSIEQYDKNHFLIYLKQQDWEIHYEKYAINKNGLYLPTKINLDNGDLHIRILISHYQ